MLFQKLTLLFSDGRGRVVVSAWGLDGTPPPQGAVTAPPPVTISLASLTADHRHTLRASNTDAGQQLTDVWRLWSDRAARSYATVLLAAARASTRAALPTQCNWRRHIWNKWFLWKHSCDKFMNICAAKIEIFNTWIPHVSTHHSTVFEVTVFKLKIFVAFIKLNRIKSNKCNNNYKNYLTEGMNTLMF